MKQKNKTEESNENGEFSIQDMGLGIHKLIATELIRVETVLKKKNLSFERSDFFTSTFAYYYGMWMAFVKRKTTQEQYSKLYELMNNLFMSFNEITYKDNLELISYNKIKFEKRFKEAIENISEGITQNGMFIDCGITDKYLKEFISEKDIELIKSEIVDIVLSKWARPVIVVLKEKKIVD